MKINYLTIVFLIASSFLSKGVPLGLGLEMFTNNEQIVYCLPLPLKEMKEKSGSERCNHSFVDKRNKNTTVDVHGFYRENTNIQLETYYKEAYNETTEESGKIVTQKDILQKHDCYYAIGYYSNFLGKYEFIEATWVRKDEVLKLAIQYPTKDHTLWFKRLQIILQNATCS